MPPRKDKQEDPINILYVDTVFWTFFFDVEQRGFIRSKMFKEINFNDTLFCLQAVTSSDTSITIELLRVLTKPDRRPDDGHILEVYMKLLGSGSDSQCRIMNCVTDYVSVDYGIDDLKGNITKDWTMKCVIKMKELNSLDNNLRYQQEKLLTIMTDKFRFEKELTQTIKDIAYLLKRRSLSNIFTGRQKTTFAINKCIFIERTLWCANEIVKKFRAKKNVVYDKTISQDHYLYIIYCAKSGNICVKEAADLYVAAHYYGLVYLQIECSEFMLNNMGNESVIYVLLVADLVNDQDLFCRALDTFGKYTKQIRATTQWINLAYYYGSYAQSIIDSLDRKCMSKEWPLSISDDTPGTSTGKMSKTPGTSASKESHNISDILPKKYDQSKSTERKSASLKKGSKKGHGKGNWHG